MRAHDASPNRTGSGRIRASGLVTTLLVIGACIVPEHSKAAEMPPVPDAPCTLGERMNIHLVEGWMYECGCSVLATGFHCGWDLVGQVGTAEIRKTRKIKKHHKRHVIVRFQFPAVVR